MMMVVDFVVVDVVVGGGAAASSPSQQLCDVDLPRPRFRGGLYMGAALSPFHWWGKGLFYLLRRGFVEKKELTRFCLPWHFWHIFFCTEPT